MLLFINTKSCWLSSQRCQLLAVRLSTSGTETEKASAATGKAAAILEAQQKDAAAERKPFEARQQEVEQDKKPHNSAAAKERQELAIQRFLSTIERGL